MPDISSGIFDCATQPHFLLRAHAITLFGTHVARNGGWAPQPLI